MTHFCKVKSRDDVYTLLLKKTNSRNLTAVDKEKQFAVAVMDAVKNARLLKSALRGKIFQKCFKIIFCTQIRLFVSLGFLADSRGNISDPNSDCDAETV